LFWWVYCYIFHLLMFVHRLNFIWKNWLWGIVLAVFINIFIIFIWIHLWATFQDSTLNLFWCKWIYIAFFIFLCNLMGLLYGFSSALVPVIRLQTFVFFSFIKLRFILVLIVFMNLNVWAISNMRKFVFLFYIFIDLIELYLL
jgi:hypothetical protein